MTVLLHSIPWLVTMLGLIVASGFFSGAEAALFYLGWRDLREMASGNVRERAAVRLLDDADRLLGAVLFWNLLINIVYFAAASILALSWERAGYAKAAGLLAVGSLAALIGCSELLPKSLAVLRPRLVAAWVALPLTATIRAADPIVPLLRKTAVAIERVIWPGFQPEPYLRLRDLEKAVAWSSVNAALLEQEQVILQNLVQLSEIKAEEAMRPRTEVKLRRLPCRWDELDGHRLTPELLRQWLSDNGSAGVDNNFLLLAEPESDEIVGYLEPRRLLAEQTPSLAEVVEPVVYVPWCVNAAKVLDDLRRQGCEVAVVVNEYGETDGLLTVDDLMRTVFSSWGGRSDWLLRQRAIRAVSPGVWHVTGLTSLRRLVRYFGVPRPESVSVTVAGVIQERLERLPHEGDECDWGPFHFRVLRLSRRGVHLVEVTKRPIAEEVPE